MRLCSIASGSSGNCIYVGTDTTHVLVDVVSYFQKNTMCKWSAVFCRSRYSVGC